MRLRRRAKGVVDGTREGLGVDTFSIRIEQPRFAQEPFRVQSTAAVDDQ
jgi:hypothetical protein